LNDLRENRQKLNILYDIGKKISPLEISSSYSSLRTSQLEKIVEKVLLHDKSILRTIDHIQIDSSEFDVSIIASAARNIMECTNLYFHISERKITPDEIELRFQTMYLNALINLTDIYQKLSFSLNGFRARLEMDSLHRTRDKIKSLSSFLVKTENEKAQILSGRKAAVNVKSPSILNKQLESAIYNVLSNSVHSLFIGLGNNSINYNGFYRTFFDVIKLLNISLAVSTIYTAHVLKDYLDLRKRFYRLINEKEKNQIKEFKSTEALTIYRITEN